MITSDLKGNHTYCKAKCKSKCQPFMLFHLHHIHCCWMWAGETVCWPLPVFVLFFSLSSVNITSNYIQCNTKTFQTQSYSIAHFFLWWQGFDWMTTLKLKSVFELWHLCALLWGNVCFTVCTVSSQWVTHTLFCVGWCWRVVSESERFGITVLLKRGWDNLKCCNCW